MNRSLVAMLLALVGISPVAGESCQAADFSVLDYGAVGDAERLNTASLQAAIDAAHRAGGGRVVVPGGVFRSGALFLKPGVSLRLEAGAVLRGSSSIEDFPTRPTRIEGKVQPWRPALLNAEGVDDVIVDGAGTLDGAGEPYWKAFWKRRAENPRCTNLEVERPRLMYFESCRGVVVRGLRLKDSGFWNLHLYRCSSVLLEGLRITAPHGDPPKITGDSAPWDEVSIDRAPSSDGIDIDSCQRVKILRCTISVGDDCIALKGTKGPTALQDESSPPVEDILVEDCDFVSGHGALTCGSEATVIRGVVVRACRIGAAIPVVRLKLRPDTPQRYEQLVFEDLTLGGAQALFDVKPWTQFFDLAGHGPQPSVVDGVVVRGVRGTAQGLGELRGNDGDTIRNVRLEDVELDVEAPALRLGEGVRVVAESVSINGAPFAADGSPLSAERAENRGHSLPNPPPPPRR